MNCLPTRELERNEMTDLVYLTLVSLGQRRTPSGFLEINIEHPL